MLQLQDFLHERIAVQQIGDRVAAGIGVPVLDVLRRRQVDLLFDPGMQRVGGPAAAGQVERRLN